MADITSNIESILEDILCELSMMNSILSCMSDGVGYSTYLAEKEKQESKSGE